jgi:hypothetical protein
MKKIFSLLFICCNFSITLFSQNVGINNTGAAPVASAMLDIVSSDKGLLVPRFALSDITVAAPVVAPAVSLIVYNTATAGVSPNNVLPGFYYWDGTKWVAFSGSGGREWALLGNAGTVAGTNFLGTTDNVDLQFRVNNIQGGKINIANSQTFFGYQAGLATTGVGNSFFGTNSGIANAGGTHNTAIGNLTFTTSTIGNFNTTVGYGSMRNNLSGSNNTFLGVNAGANWSTTSNNTGVGMFALQGLAAGTGVGNTALGYAAGSGTTPNNLATGNGSYNTFLGYNTAINGSAFTNATAIGANALAGASNVLILGSINGTNGATSDTKVGIGTTVPGTSNGGNVSVEKFNILSSTVPAGAALAEITNTSTQGLNLVVSSNNAAAVTNNLVGVINVTANGGLSAVYGLALPAGNNTTIGVRGAGNNSNNYGVRGSIPTAGPWLGLGGLFTGGLGYANGIYNLSDRRVKKDVVPITNAVSIIQKLNGVSYKYNTDVFISAKGDDRTYLGFIAQDVEAVLPEIVGSKNIPLGSSENLNSNSVENNFLNAKLVDYVQVVPVLVEAIKEQQKQIEELKNEIQKLKKEK